MICGNVNLFLVLYKGCKVMLICHQASYVFIHNPICVGDIVRVTVLRSAPALGRVTVSWSIRGISTGSSPPLRFKVFTGTLFFEEVNGLFPVINEILQHTQVVLF